MCAGMLIWLRLLPFTSLRSNVIPPMPDPHPQSAVPTQPRANTTFVIPLPASARSTPPTIFPIDSAYAYSFMGLARLSMNTNSG